MKSLACSRQTVDANDAEDAAHLEVTSHSSVIRGSSHHCWPGAASFQVHTHDGSVASGSASRTAPSAPLPWKSQSAPSDPVPAHTILEPGRQIQHQTHRGGIPAWANRLRRLTARTRRAWGFASTYNWRRFGLPFRKRVGVPLCCLICATIHGLLTRSTARLSGATRELTITIGKPCNRGSISSTRTGRPPEPSGSRPGCTARHGPRPCRRNEAPSSRRMQSIRWCTWPHVARL